MDESDSDSGGAKAETEETKVFDRFEEHCSSRTNDIDIA